MSNEHAFAKAATTISSAKRLAVLSGAGMSRESGLPTFRDVDGLWSKHSIEEVATAQALQRDPQKVWDWHLAMRERYAAVQPNAGHFGLAELEAHVQVQVVTQNVDNLHERAGSSKVIHLHGSAFAYRCDQCRFPMQLPAEPLEWNKQRESVRCPRCAGHIRFDVVLFEEPLNDHRLLEAAEAVVQADAVIVVGTSSLVYPAAEFPKLAIECQKFVVEVNPQETPFSGLASARIATTAAVGIPELVRRVRMGSA